MATTTTAPPRTEPPRPSPDGPAGAAGRSFFRWGLVGYLAVTAVVVAAIVWWLDGHFVYVLDDPAIHLSIADRLAQDGTWGVVPGEFQSASSAPLWTALVAVALVVARPAAEWVPLAMNVAAGVATVWVLAQVPTTVVPGRRRPLDAAAVVVLVTVVLFLPGLAVVGMEHTLHVALVLAAVLEVHRRVLGEAGPGPAATYALVALATLTRFETAFVALGLAVALVAADRSHLRRAVGVLAASGLPIVAFGLVNRAMGGGWLPNSVLAKGQVTGSGSDGSSPFDVAGRLTEDPALAVLLAVAVGYLALAGHRSRARAAVPAVTLAVAAPLHAALADMGWYQRYQAYLVAIGVYLVLALLAEVPPALHRRAVAVVCLVGLVFAAGKANLLAQAPRAADDMYRQQYQAGLFLDRYYDDRAVATDQLGYISWFHDGPLTDFAGLGDHEVLQATSDGAAPADLWPALGAERGFEVVVLYDKSAGLNVPREWVLAGEWRIDGEPLSGVSGTLQFFATAPEGIAPLQDHLRDFEADLPARSHLVINENAGLQGLALDTG